MKKVFLVICFLLIGTMVQASPYYFTGASGNSAWIEVDAWTGSGENETILVVDWNIYSGPYQTESHAFGFRWNGTAYESDMLDALNDAGVFTLSSGYGGAFIYDIVYNDGVDNHTHADEEGSWNLGSTNDPFALWGAMSDDWITLGDWYANRAGYNEELLADGQLEGINAITWFNGDPNAYFLDVPFAAPVPIPGALWLLGSGIIGLIGLRKRSK
ncbi:MAG: VPLPA-CTERM sorting domain-containing protein [Deltaproteobacteria bacterium]|nr:VPLPA-CTERM sorting domain-containing protein [Deltaproteobacteria bacterium]